MHSIESAEKEDENMAMNDKYPNSGILFRETGKRDATDRDYKGAGDITCSCGKRTSLWLSGWIKTGTKGKFLSLRFKEKDAQSAATARPAAAADDEF